MNINLPDYFDAYARDYSLYKGGASCYEDGCLYRGLIMLHEATGEERWFRHLKRLADAQVGPNGELAGYTVDEYNIDNMLPGRAFLYLAGRTGDDRYRKAADLLAKQLETHPRIEAGPHWHKLRYPHQVWLDGLYMALPFKAEYAASAPQPKLAEQALSEMLTALRLTEDKDANLYRHGYDESRQQKWADPATGLSPAHWGRSLGWLAMALVDLIDALPPGASTNQLSARLLSLLLRLQELQLPDGRWLQVIDQPDLPGNYAESSATAMLAYAYMKAARLPGLSPALADTGQKALDGLMTNAMIKNADGRTVLGNICCVAGLGGFDGNYRDGTPEYYLTEVLRDDDIKGVAPLMMAYSELVSAGDAMAGQHRIPA